MRYQSLFILFSAIISSVLGQDTLLQPGRSFDDACAGLPARLAHIANATVWFAQPIAAGTNLTLVGNNATCERPGGVVHTDTCRVALRVTTSSRSEISMEAWLPREWSGRFLSTGNGGLGGCIQYEDMSYATQLGFATVGTNNGHNGTSGGAFLNNPETVADFAYRAVHTGVEVGKEISRTFYGSDHRRSYYFGCSTGGRQGIKSALAFPNDFDGIIAGAPGVDFNDLVSWTLSVYNLTGPSGSPTYLSPQLWTTVHQDILRQCDGIDGAEDGVLEDPRLCDYRPEALLCGSSTSTDCLTSAQAETVRGIFSPLHGVDGALVFPRLQPGGELTPPFVSFGMPFQIGVDWFRYAVYNDPNWDPNTTTPRDYANAASVNPGGIETWEGDLSSFRRRGGKLLAWHGLADGLVTSDNTARYYDHVSRTMGLRSAQLDDFFRYFRISGLGHCSGGDGAWAIGQGILGNATTAPEGNVLTSLVRWVEQGIAPERIEGTKFVNDSREQGVAFRRAHCRYPLRNVYSGSGDWRLPENWRCI